MAIIFLSYRRTDSPQACRVYDWLVQRFGHDAVFMDVSNIPFAVSFTDYIKQEISNSKVLIALIGAGWQTKIREADDPVRMELETAVASQIPVLPVLVGNTPMPNPEELPQILANIARQNAETVGISHDFHTHMQMLLPKIEAILGALARENVVTSDPDVINIGCAAVIRYLKEEFDKTTMRYSVPVSWRVIGPEELFSGAPPDKSVTLYLHRIARLAELLELHFILSFWWPNAENSQRFAGWTLRQFEQTPLIPAAFLWQYGTEEPEYDLKVRRSDEDPRQIWKMITDQPLQLSLAYVATISPKTSTIPSKKASNDLEPK